MPSNPCLIHFTDAKETEQAYVYRNQYGHPEEVISNIENLQTRIEMLGEVPSPGELAAQFVFLDKLWYLLSEVAPEEIEAELLNLLLEPEQVDAETSQRYLQGHSVVDSRTKIEGNLYVYEVTVSDIRETQWQLNIGQWNESETALVGTIVESVEWIVCETLCDEVSKKDY